VESELCGECRFDTWMAPRTRNYTAVGYDTVTGLGVPNGTTFFKALK